MAESGYNPLIDGNELKGLLGVSQATIERWVSARIIPSFRFGRKCVRFDYLAVRNALAKFEKPAYRRLPRGPYSVRREKSKPTEDPIQLELLLRSDDPAQLLLPMTCLNENSRQ